MTARQSGMAREALPAELGTPRAKLVYLYLRTNRGATVAELCDDLDLPQITLLPTLRSLREKGLVEKRSGTYRPARV